MQFKSSISEKVYSIHLEFTKDSTGIGEEIRETLRKKYLEKMKSGYMQTEACAVQFTIQDKEETEGKDV